MNQMSYTPSDWTIACNKLESARASYDSVTNLDKKARKEGDMDTTVVMNCWSFGEYAVNVILEFEKLRIPTNHSQPAEAKKLFNAGKLKADYSAVLQDLERYRKKATHLGYAKDKTVKYGDGDLLTCLVAMEALRPEVEAAIATHAAKAPKTSP